MVENPEARTEGLKFIMLHESSIKDAETKEMVKPLVACLTDKAKAIRELAEQVIKVVMPLVGHSKFLEATKDRPTAVQQTLKPILEKIKGRVAAAAAPAKRDKSPEPEPKKDFQPSFRRKPGPASNDDDDEEEEEEEEKKPQKVIAKKAKPAPPSRKKKGDDEEDLQIKVVPKKKRA